MTLDFSERLKALPPYLFKELDRIRDEVRARGVDVIDLGVGDQDQPTPGYVIDALDKAARDPANHRYPVYSGMDSMLDVVAGWYRRRHGVALDPRSEICTLIGSKEGIAQFPLAFVNPGDVVICPEPGYPVYRSGTIFSGGVPYFAPLLERNSFLPDLAAIPEDVLRKAKIIWVNYPNNPTGAKADPAFYKELIAFAGKWDLIVASDAAYSEVTHLPEPHPSILGVEGAMERAVEFHSLSKTFNMTGWRLGWAAGNAALVKGLGLVKSNVDSGVFQAVQLAGMAALGGSLEPIHSMGELYLKRRGAVEAALDKAGIGYLRTDYTFYVWGKVPGGLGSAEFCSRLLNLTGIVVTPGNGFGPSGEGYFRIALVQDSARLEEAARRLAGFKL
jgi:LL-diaminopimelate aminotransferase